MVLRRWLKVMLTYCCALRHGVSLTSARSDDEHAPTAARQTLGIDHSGGRDLAVAPRGCSTPGRSGATSANDESGLAPPGAADRGHRHEMASVGGDHAKAENEVIAVHLVRGLGDAASEEWSGTDAKQAATNDLLGLADVDVVFISSARSLALRPPRGGDERAQARLRREADGDRHRRMNRLRDRESLRLIDLPGHAAAQHGRRDGLLVNRRSRQTRPTSSCIEQYVRRTT